MQSTDKVSLWRSYLIGELLVFSFSNVWDDGCLIKMMQDACSIPQSKGLHAVLFGRNRASLEDVGDHASQSSLRSISNHVCWPSYCFLHTMLLASYISTPSITFLLSQHQSTFPRFLIPSSSCLPEVSAVQLYCLSDLSPGTEFSTKNRVISTLLQQSKEHLRMG